MLVSFITLILTLTLTLTLTLIGHFRLVHRVLLRRHHLHRRLRGRSALHLSGLLWIREPRG